MKGVMAAPLPVITPKFNQSYLTNQSILFTHTANLQVHLFLLNNSDVIIVLFKRK